MWRSVGEWLHLHSGVEGERAGVSGGRRADWGDRKDRSLWLSRQLELLEDPEPGMATDGAVVREMWCLRPTPPRPGVCCRTSLEEEAGGRGPQSGGLG